MLALHDSNTLIKKKIKFQSGAVAKSYMTKGDGWLSLGGWVARQLATAALWVRVHTSLKNHKGATWSDRHTLARQKTYKKIYIYMTNDIFIYGEIFAHFLIY